MLHRRPSPDLSPIKPADDDGVEKEKETLDEELAAAYTGIKDMSISEADLPEHDANGWTFDLLIIDLLS